MPRIPAGTPLIPAHVTLRSLRQARGLTGAQLAERLQDRGVTVETNHIYDVEVGRIGLSLELRLAWAGELGIGHRDIRTGAEIRDLVADADAEAARTAAA